MVPPDEKSPHRSEWDLLHALRETPELISRVLAETGNELHHQTQLRREYPEALVRAAFALCDLRQKAATKFTRADRMWFDRVGLEQATPEPVARHKAQRFSGEVVDLCCGIGGDSLALAAHCQVTAVDRNPVSCLRAAWNAEAYEVATPLELRCDDAEQVATEGRLVHLDPDRRAQAAGRALRVEDYLPGLEFMQRLAAASRGGAIKLGPASNFGGKFPEAEIELISLHGECKEATVWFGELRGDSPWRATVLPSGQTIAGHPLDFLAEQSPVGAYLFDPDPAVVRSGLVDAVALELGLKRLDREEEYLTGDTAVASPFVQTFEVIAELANNPAEIRGYFRTSRYGQVEIKCRRIPTDADAIRRKLPLPGDAPAVLIFARVAGKARALVCHRVPRGGLEI